MISANYTEVADRLRESLELEAHGKGECPLVCLLCQAPIRSRLFH
jgi:hypothetical protein